LLDAMSLRSMIRKHTAASSGEAELAEDDATSACSTEAELTAGSPPTSVWVTPQDYTSFRKGLLMPLAEASR
jgi:hypothetical protein